MGIFRILEVLHAIPDRTFITLLTTQIKKFKTTQKMIIQPLQPLDEYLLNECRIPAEILSKLNILGDNETRKIPIEDLERLLKKIYSSDFDAYFQKLENDYLGKLNETRNAELGVVYTPKSIVNHMVYQSFSRYFERELDIEDFSVFDPACGTGMFLVRSLVAIFEKLNEEKHLAIQEIAKKTLSSCYGCDIDEIAVLFTHMNLWLSVIQFYSKNNIHINFPSISHELFAILKRNVVKKDSLNFSKELNSFPYNIPGYHGFSIIIGNPPYISSKDLPVNYKELLRSRFKTAIHQFDIYSIFIELSISLLDSNGILSLIVPESYLGRSSFMENRKLLLEQTSIVQIENIQRAFPQKSVSNIILVCKKPKVLDNHFKYIQFMERDDFDSDSGVYCSVSQDYCYNLDNYKILCHSPNIQEIIEKITFRTTPLGKYIKIHRGEEIGKKSDLILHEPKKFSNKIVFGENIDSFCINEKSTYIRAKDIKKSNAFYSQPKILIRQLGSRIKAALDAKGEFVTIQTVYNMISTHETISNDFLLGFLNSNLVQFYYEMIYREKQIFPRILLENLLCLPFVPPDKKSQEKISDLTRKIMQSKKSQADESEMIAQLNSTVYDLFQLDKSERKKIEKYLSRNY